MSDEMSENLRILRIFNALYNTLPKLVQLDHIKKHGVVASFLIYKTTCTKEEANVVLDDVAEMFDKIGISDLGKLYSIYEYIQGLY